MIGFFFGLLIPLTYLGISVLAYLERIETNQKINAMKLSELSAQLDLIHTDAQAAKAAILAKIAAGQTQPADPEIPTAAISSIETLKSDITELAQIGAS